MESAFDDVRFLASSSNRTAVLSLLASGATSRDELADVVDASPVTLRRILGDLEDRSWIEREGPGYAATATGATIAVEFERLLDATRAFSRSRSFAPPTTVERAPRRPPRKNIYSLSHDSQPSNARG